MNIFISGLSFNTNDEQLKKLFTPFGEVSSAKVINDRETGRSRGFGFVTLNDNEAAAKAIDQLNQSTVDGRTIKVTEAIEKERTNTGSNNGGGYRKNNSGFNNNNRW